MLHKILYFSVVLVTLTNLSACGINNDSETKTLSLPKQTDFSHVNSDSIKVSSSSRILQNDLDFKAWEENAEWSSHVDVWEYSTQQGVLTPKTYDDFLTAIRTFESTIDPKNAQYYADNYDNPSAVPYPKVEYPGRVIRDNQGDPEKSTTSVKRYFQKIGVDHLYTKGTTDPEVFKKMQYAVINYLGFVGYQFSEQDLWVLGYYIHTTAHSIPVIYSDVPNSVWANGVRSTVGRVNDFGWSVITDVNTWKGIWLGKHGINSFEDLMNPDKQDFVAKDHFQFKYNKIVEALAAHGKTLKQYIGTKLYWNECTPPISPPPGGRSNEVTVTMSGLLAGAHLRGAAGVEALLINHENHADENNTTILQYVQDFGGYQTPFDPNVKNSDQ